MGGNSSKNVNIFNMSSVTDIMYNQLTENTTKISQTGTNINTSTISIAGNVTGCTFRNDQKITADQVSTGNITADQVSNIQNDIQANLDAQIEQTAKQENEMLSGFANSNANINKVKQAIHNIVRTTITVKNFMEIKQQSFNLNELNLTILGTYTCTTDEQGVYNNQDIASSMLAEGMTNSLVEAINNNKVISDITAEAEQYAEQKNKGLADVMSKFLMPCLSSGAVICVVCAGMVAVMLSPAGQNAVSKGANAAAKYAK
jgi:hypothetical protein